MRIKRGVQIDGLEPVTYYAIGVAERIGRELGYNIVITAGRDGKHKVGSLHYQGLAVDLRSKNIAASSQALIFGHLQEHLEPLGFDVVKEGDHWHIEFQPKGKETWITEVN